MIGNCPTKFDDRASPKGGPFLSIEVSIDIANQYFKKIREGIR
ncbi:unnamed protein product [marine sediment metagenome]|uniref:Uncharacterized protein n=1 Tax=marine sediment metagenome TaxID=412755 RepID=X0SDI5_9ZZZZ